MKELFDAALSGLRQEEKKLSELSDLLEYPEIQADKGYCLSLLNDYNALKTKVEIKKDLQNTLDEYEKLDTLSVSSEEEALITAEKNALYDRALLLKAKLFEEGGEETVLYRVTTEGETGAKVAKDLFSVCGKYLTSDKKEITIDKEFSFSVTGQNAVKIAALFIGKHRVRTGKNTESFTVTAVLSEPEPTYQEEDFRFTVFHSSGAGGQNINKVETAVRVTHLPTGTVVTCQDERSQLKNKRRAYENIIKKLRAGWEKERKTRAEEERRLQQKRVGFVVDVVKNTLVAGERSYPYPFDENVAKRFIEEGALL